MTVAVAARSASLFLSSCAALLLFTATALADKNAAEDLRVETAVGAGLSVEALVDALAEADVIVLGEVHDNPAHHAVQAEVVAALAARAPGVSGLAFEMVPETREDAVNTARASGADTAALAEAIGWADLGWPDFALYAPIFAAAPDAYVAGGQPPRSELMRLAQEGAAADALAEKFGLDEPLPAEQQAERETRQIEAHCNAMPAEMAPMLVAAQRVRDAHFAEAALRARAAGTGRAVLITGTGHARTDYAVPALLRRAAPELTVLSVGMVEAVDGDIAESARASFDFIVRAAPVEREDPCAVFRKKG